jgi:2-polyprenyl-3-methyl-5-hydroxy-6-metoxy-1,4-benzoquinol methylase
MPMKSIADNLTSRRVDAALFSKGTSSHPIRSLARGLLALYCPKGDLLDYGAGMGGLLMEIKESFEYDYLCGCDIMGRPGKIADDIGWLSQDLNGDVACDRQFDVIVSTEVIEHLENPRSMVRNIYSLLKPGGIMVLTTPNQNSIRSILSLVFNGHFVAFTDSSYPAHITALTIIDLDRISLEAGFEKPGFFYTNHGDCRNFPV